MQERRRAKRIKKRLHIQCRSFDRLAAWCSVIAQDISELGMCISTARRFAKGEQLEVKISTLLRFRPINILGSVVDVARQGSRRTRWVVRIEFIKINEEDKQILHQHIESLSGLMSNNNMHSTKLD